MMQEVGACRRNAGSIPEIRSQPPEVLRDLLSPAMARLFSKAIELEAMDEGNF
jgi:hypothetical protein